MFPFWIVDSNQFFEAPNILQKNIVTVGSYRAVLVNGRPFSAQLTHMMTVISMPLEMRK